MIFQAEINDRMCVCFRWTETVDGTATIHFSKMCGKCRDPNALILA